MVSKSNGYVLDKDKLDELRRLMCAFEVSVNTALPETRVHLKEE